MTNWTNEEIEMMKNVYAHTFQQEIKLFFPNRTIKAVKEKAKILELKKENRKVYFKKEFNDDYFGGYISGLIDGEGSFCVSLKNSISMNHKMKVFNPKLQINLRADDVEILKKMQSYFEAGNINFTHFNKNRMAAFCISDLYNITRSVIPHFDKYPLLAKKRTDFEIWKKMVVLQNKNYNQNNNIDYQNKMLTLYEELKINRLYKEIIW